MLAGQRLRALARSFNNPEYSQAIDRHMQRSAEAGAQRRAHERLLAAHTASQVGLRPDQRAEELFLAALSPEQRWTWDKLGYIKIVGSDGGLYYLFQKMSYNVIRVSQTTAQGLCAVTRNQAIPRFDQYLGQMLWIETNAPAFLECAIPDKPQPLVIAQQYYPFLPLVEGHVPTRPAPPQEPGAWIPIGTVADMRGGIYLRNHCASLEEPDEPDDRGADRAAG